MFLPVSQAVAEGTQLARYGVPYQVIPNFIPDNLAEQCDDEHPLLTKLPEEPFFLFIGDLSRDKGVEVLLQAYGRLENPAPLVLIGRPVNNFTPTIPPNVRILHSWPHAAIMSAWKRCTVALAPSLWPDPCPTVAMEAMVMGKPVIASRMGGLSDIVHNGETGLLVSPGDTQELGTAMQRLQNDATSRAAMGSMALQSIANFQARSVVSRIEQVYQEVS
jgi:glycosyltransferase involved in cell wall biosynthesis